jgi:hypothetical protein
VVHGDVKPFANAEAQFSVKSIFALSGIIDVLVFKYTRPGLLLFTDNEYASGPPSLTSSSIESNPGDRASQAGDDHALHVGRLPDEDDAESAVQSNRSPPQPGPDRSGHSLVPQRDAELSSESLVSARLSFGKVFCCKHFIGELMILDPVVLILVWIVVNALDAVGILYCKSYI